jgi:hypothetical protein
LLLSVSHFCAARLIMVCPYLGLITPTYLVKYNENVSVCSVLHTCNRTYKHASNFWWKRCLWYMIYLLTAIVLTPGGSSTVHIYTQTIHITTHLTNWEECGPCPVFARYTLAFALQLRKKHGKTSVKVAEECRLARWKQNIKNGACIKIRIYKLKNKNT